MAILEAIPHRIHDRREAFGATVEVASRWAGLSPQRWRSIEAGGPFTMAELRRIGHALVLDPGILMRGEERDPRRTVARFRRDVSGRDATSEEARILARAAQLGRIGGGLYELLGRSVPLETARRAIPVADDQEPPWRQGYALGEAARETLEVPSAGPLVDLQAHLQGLGIHIASVEFSDPAIDAASLMEPGAMPVVLLNRSSPRVQYSLSRRTALAHELCHLLHDAGEHDLETHVTRRHATVDPDSVSENDVIEQRARGFAPAFLAPREDLRHWFELGGGADLEEPEERVRSLAERWGFSWEGACWHAKNCQLIDSRTAEALRVSLGPKPTWAQNFEPSAGQSTEPPSFIEPRELPDGLTTGVIMELAQEALAAGVISEGRAREVLIWS